MLYQDNNDPATSELMRGLRNRDPEIVSRLIDEHKGRLFAFLFSLTENRDTAQDLFQETWLRVLERGYQYRGEWKFESWLLSIAKNLVIDQARRKRELSLEVLSKRHDGPPFEPAAHPAPTPLDLLTQRERNQRLQQHLRRLPANCREVVLMRVRDGLPLQKMAELLRVPITTVKARLYRTVALLNQRMEACGA